MGTQNHMVTSDDLHTLDKLLGVSMPEGSVVIDMDGWSLKLHSIAETTIQPVNTGQVLDKIVTLEEDSLISFQRNVIFNAALKNLQKPDQAILGIMFCMDDVGPSPADDIDDIAIDLLLGYKSGTSRTYIASQVTNILYKLDSHYISANLANVATMPYFGPLRFPFLKPLIVKPSDTITEYLSHMTRVWRRTAADRYAFTAHSAVTTYTLAFKSWLVIVDTSVAKSLGIDAIWAKLEGV